MAGLEHIGVSKIDPLAYASFLDGYAESLKATGLVEPAAEITRVSAAIKQEHKGERLNFAVRRYKR
ncbi:MAG: hypothetical protein EXS39_02140 [Opitutaceae bacterium]|nr:hypothetical protein [Opitutaceae bacterium]